MFEVYGHKKAFQIKRKEVKTIEEENSEQNNRL